MEERAPTMALAVTFVHALMAIREPIANTVIGEMGGGEWMLILKKIYFRQI
jgi:hypothetical protein